MRLIVDIFCIIMMFVFAYAFGRKSESDGKPVIPVTVTWYTLFIVLIIMLLLNLPDIINLMKMYSGKG